MKLYPLVVSLFIGFMIGALYWAIGVQSPAPIPIALLGLVGILSGEWIVTTLRRRFTHHGSAADTTRSGPDPSPGPGSAPDPDSGS